MSASRPYQTKLDQRPVEITHVEHGSKGTYTAKAQGLEGLAEMTYSRAARSDHRGSHGGR